MPSPPLVISSLFVSPNFRKGLSAKASRHNPSMDQKTCARVEAPVPMRPTALRDHGERVTNNYFAKRPLHSRHIPLLYLESRGFPRWLSDGWRTSTGRGNQQPSGPIRACPVWPFWKRQAQGPWGLVRRCRWRPLGSHLPPTGDPGNFVRLGEKVKNRSE